jgi:hypothetical protein
LLIADCSQLTAQNKPTVMKTQIMLIALCLLSFNIDELQACDKNHQTTLATHMLPVQKNQQRCLPKPLLKEKKKEREKEESFLMYFNPYLKILSS